ncbi:aspartate carbamoyltransferase regulatory subunit [Patescibacteria group bacterium]|nr:aspartate carbamoyltransferase regulatory subunit [Patescibacteria group bacterium]MBU1075006.1 aspartate carbamoyltransferase regulatory subunit [Patescibacteria group bacterium]MBU1952430.1 aspartate carbamoyltransferase regulatory subunit [Patescibacteria group bacterium]MBU2235951.1 aspartate carbamoyltransferase regulatory subunit [Patescibacteria group bacterium]
MRAYKVYAIKDGTVIDHIPSGKGLEVINLLGIAGDQNIITLGMHFASKSNKKKDVVKIEKRELTPEEVNKLAIIASTATINIIRDFKVAKKIPITIPNQINGIIKCGNPSCITNHEPVVTKFSLAKKNPIKLYCFFCERTFDLDEITLA